MRICNRVGIYCFDYYCLAFYVQILRGESLLIWGEGVLLSQLLVRFMTLRPCLVVFFLMLLIIIIIDIPHTSERAGRRCEWASYFFFFGGRVYNNNDMNFKLCIR